jgi:CRISPR-associated endonuclease/helicase Cas3
LTEEEHELALHLIASHHGRARPCFPDSAMDKRQVLRSREEALEAARRFARLQRRHGAWGLAYLEALFCAADAMASRESPEDPDHA